MTKIYGTMGVCIDYVEMNKDVDMLIWVNDKGVIIYDYWVLVTIQTYHRCEL